MVVIAALVGREDASSLLLLGAIETGDVRLALSDEGLRELHRVARYPKVEATMPSPARALRIGQAMGTMGKLHRPRRLEWPSLLDLGDWWILDLAFESGADYIVTLNERHLGPARDLGFVVRTPQETIARILRADP